MNESLIVEFCLAFTRIGRSGHGYGHLPARYQREEQQRLTDDPATAYALNRVLYTALLDRFSLDESLLELPHSVQSLYSGELERIAHNASRHPDGYFISSNDSFRKDLALLTHRLIPCGAEFFYPFAGIPRSIALRDGPAGLLRFLRTVLSTRGLKPMLELHLHAEVTDRFNPASWLASYEHLADVLELNPEFRGVQSFSWFLDPALRLISPHLAYLREVPEQCGASIFFIADDNPSTSGALSASRTRRRLADSGQYQPKIYGRIWPRKRLLERRWRLLN